MELLERLEPSLDTSAITGGNPMHRVLLVVNESDVPFTGWARLAVDFQTRRRYAIQISDASGATCRHHRRLPQGGDVPPMKICAPKLSRRSVTAEALRSEPETS